MSVAPMPSSPAWRGYGRRGHPNPALLHTAHDGVGVRRREESNPRTQQASMMMMYQKG